MPPKGKVPCPVEGCDEVFKDEASAAAHMKAMHRDHFTAHSGEPMTQFTVKIDPEAEDEENPSAALAMVPPEIMKLMDSRIDERVQAALEAERPQIAAAVKGAIEQVLAQAKAAGIAVLGVPLAPGEGGVVPGSQVTPAGAQLISWMTKSDQSSDMENLAKMLTQARAISDVLNPPTMWDRVMQNVVVRSLRQTGLLTGTEADTLTKQIGDLKLEGKPT